MFETLFAHHPARCVLLVLASSTAALFCQVPPGTPAAAPAIVPPPLSASAALVRALEVLGDHRAEARLEIHSLESRYEPLDPGSQEVRSVGQAILVGIDVTIHARDDFRAREIFDEAEQAARRPAAVKRADASDYGGIRRTWIQLEWGDSAAARAETGELGGSYRARFELRTTSEAVEPRWVGTPFLSAEALEAGQVPGVVRGQAFDDLIQLGQVRIRSQPATGAAAAREPALYSITPEAQGASLSRVQIANFLFRLEERIPNARVAGLRVARSLSGEGATGWNYEVELGVWPVEAR